MPFFFIIAGFTHRRKVLPDYRACKNWFLTKVRAYLIPYLFMMMLSDGVTWRKLFDYLRPHRDILSGYSPLGMWFLPCFFCSVLIYQAIIQVSSSGKRGEILRTVLAIVSLLCGLQLRRYGNMYFYINVALVGVGLIEIGVQLRALMEKTHLLEFRMPVKISLSLLLFVITSLISEKNDTVYMVLNYYGNVPMAMTTGITGSISLILLSSCIKSQWIQQLGRNSVIILQFHTIWVRFVEILMGKIERIIPVFFSFAPVLPIYRMALAVGIVISMYPLIIVVNKYLPVISGKGTKIP